MKGTKETITIKELAEKMGKKQSQVAIALMPYGVEATGEDFKVDIEIANKLQGVEADIKSLKAAPERQELQVGEAAQRSASPPPQTDSRVGQPYQTTDNEAAIEKAISTSLSLQDCQLISEIHDISVEKVQQLEQILNSEEEALALASGVYDAEKHIALYNAGNALVYTQEYKRRSDRNAATRKKVVEGRLDLGALLQTQGIDIHDMMDGLQADEFNKQKQLETSLTVPFDFEQLNQVIAILSPTGMDVNDLVSGAIVEGTPAYIKAQNALHKNGINIKSFINRQNNYKAATDEKKDQLQEVNNSLGLTRLINFSKVSTIYKP